jgi:outer membrane protein assembly factor BamB
VPATPATASSRTGPRIGSVSPAHGAAGTKVTITGSGFTRVRAVRFDGVAARFKVRSASRITAAVPAMPSAAGPVTVTTRGGTATSRARFTVTPRIALSPATGPPWTVVTVSGTGFGALEGADIFAGTADEALAGTGPAGSFGPIRVTIPASAVPGTAWISAEGRHTRLFAQAAFTVNTNWPQYRYPGTHTGTNPFENVLSTADVAQLCLDWSFTTYAFLPFTPASSPAVASGVVYIGNGNVYALNAATGAKRWTFPTGNKVFSAPAVANWVVYTGSNDHNVYALNAATGAQLWTFTTGNEVNSTPAIANGMVYADSGEGNVYAFGLAGGLATPARPSRNSLHPDYNLPQQR